jgi:hypothetical protein
MVRAILDDSKTHTRRIVKPQPTKIAGPNFDGLWSDTIDPVVRYFACPYGQPGDRLWVRETWQFCDYDASGGYPKTEPVYRADGETDDKRKGWVPSIHMPRWASRITLEIVSVRVERLNEISESDAIAEGVQAEGGLWKNYLGGASQLMAYHSYATLWESIYGEAVHSEFELSGEPDYRDSGQESAGEDKQA